MRHLLLRACPQRHTNRNPHTHTLSRNYHKSTLHTLRSEQTSAGLGQLKMDKSLTSVSGAQAAYVGLPYDIWQVDRTLSHLQRHQRKCLPDIRLSQSQGAADSQIQGHLSLPYDLYRVPLLKVIWLALSSESWGDFTAGLPSLYPLQAADRNTGHEESPVPPVPTILWFQLSIESSVSYPSNFRLSTQMWHVEVKQMELNNSAFRQCWTLQN